MTSAGHAKRNEFTVDGRLLIGYGGTEALQSPDTLYGAAARSLLRALGVDHRRFERYFDRGPVPVPRTFPRRVLHA